MSVKTWNSLSKYLQAFLLKSGLEEEEVTTIMESWSEEKSAVLKLIVTSTTTRKSKDPNAPKKWRSSYIWYCGDVRNQIKEDNPDMKATDITREMGKMWRQLTDRQKKKYQKQAEKDKERYQEEMANYTPTTNMEGNTGRKKKERTGPKRPLSSYMFYCKDIRPQLKEDNPNMKATEITKEMGRLWRGLSNDEKVLFQEQAGKDRERYEKECQKAGLRQKKVIRKKSKPVPEPEEDSDLEVESESEEESPVSKTVSTRKKRRTTGYILFCQDCRDSVKNNHPKWKAPRVTKELSKMWKGLSEDERGEFNDRAVEGETATK